jgi:hypothetical protein
MSPTGTVPVSFNIIVRPAVSQLIPLQLYIDTLKKSFSDFNLISSTMTTLDGIPAEKIVYTANFPSGLKLKFIQFFVIKDTTSYVVTSLDKYRDSIK